jgi:SAM-dependent methyltransferase
MVASEVSSFVRANLPVPPARILEVGAGNGALARALTDAGYDVVAIDPEPGGANVRTSPLHQLDEPAESFDAAVAVVSLHHVEPLRGSMLRLADVLKPGGLLLVDEFDIAAFDRRAASWWLEQRRLLGAEDHDTADELVDKHRAHLHPLDRIVGTLESGFEVSVPVRGAYLYRWGLNDSVRSVEEDAIARGQIPAVGARLLAFRKG